MSNRVNQAIICAICHRAFEEYGHSAAPVRTGRACNACNHRVVIPARLKQQRHPIYRGEDE